MATFVKSPAILGKKVANVWESIKDTVLTFALLGGCLNTPPPPQCPEIGLRKSVKNADRTSLFREDVDIINRPPPHITT